MKRHEEPTYTIEMTLDSEGHVDMIYIRILAEEIADTIEAEIPDVFIDVSKQKRVVGIELISPSKVDFHALARYMAKHFRPPKFQDIPTKVERRIERLASV